MSILINKDTKVLVQGLTGKTGTFHTEQALAYRPSIVGIADETSLEPLRTALAGSGIEVVAGDVACAAIAAIPVDVVVAGIVGLAGLPAVLAAVEAGQTVALANKESLVSAGGLVTSVARQHGARLIPVDSEHSAVFQCWMGWAHCGAEFSDRNSAICDAGDPASIRHICLTASGGPFRDTPLENFTTITPAAAIKHPNWSMGPKISIDSATMMNKGLEVIEAAWLFDLPSSSIDVLVHPQVAIHGMVYFNDGSVIAQLGTADMKTPISYALAWPGRLDWRPEPLDLAALGTLTFQAVDSTRYPCFALARQALESGGGMPTILNAANEVAVDAFLKTQISFMDIADIVAHSLEKTTEIPIDSLEAVMRLDRMARQTAEDACAAAASR